jgi:hypothetical protein
VPKTQPGKVLTFAETSQVSQSYCIAEGISTDPEKLKTVQEWSTPKNIHEIRNFWTYARITDGSIPGFSNISKPLTKLTEEKQPFQWTPDVEAPFQTLKRALCATPIISYSKPGQRFIVDTNTSNVGI